jgi:hypothetical protein
MSEWFIITEPSTNGMSGNLTTNYIPKAIGSSALDNSVIYQNGLNIGINTNQAATKLMISANDQTALFTSVRYESLVNSPAGIASLKARGTDVSPLAIIAGDEISTIAAIGYYGSGFGTTGDANFIFFAEENFTLTNRGTSCKIGTTPLGTSSVVYNFGISSEGNVSIGMPSLNPTARLQVVGFDSTPSNYAIKSDNSASAPLLYVRNDASVGIGTSLINAKLSFGNYFISTLTPTSSEQTSHIKLYESGSIYYGFGVSTDYLNIAANQSSGNIGFYTNGIKKIHINSNGKLNINNSANPNQNTAELAITGSSSSSSNYGIYLENLGFNPIFNVRNDGNVGIGTNAATTKLQVVGLPTYANNAAAISASLTAGAFYIRTGHGLDVVV